MGHRGHRGKGIKDKGKKVINEEKDLSNEEKAALRKSKKHDHTQKTDVICVFTGCSDYFDSIPGMRSHQKTAHKKFYTQCTRCLLVFADETTYSNHGHMCKPVKK